MAKQVVEEGRNQYCKWFCNHQPENVDADWFISGGQSIRVRRSNQGIGGQIHQAAIGIQDDSQVK